MKKDQPTAFYVNRILSAIEYEEGQTTPAEIANEIAATEERLARLRSLLEACDTGNAPVHWKEQA